MTGQRGGAAPGQPDFRVEVRRRGDGRTQALVRVLRYSMYLEVPADDCEAAVRDGIAVFLGVQPNSFTFHLELMDG